MPSFDRDWAKTEYFPWPRVIRRVQTGVWVICDGISGAFVLGRRNGGSQRVVAEKVAIHAWAPVATPASSLGQGYPHPSPDGGVIRGVVYQTRQEFAGNMVGLLCIQKHCRMHRSSSPSRLCANGRRVGVSERGLRADCSVRFSHHTWPKLMK